MLPRHSAQVGVEPPTRGPFIAPRICAANLSEGPPNRRRRVPLQFVRSSRSYQSTKAGQVQTAARHGAAWPPHISPSSSAKSIASSDARSRTLASPTRCPHSAALRGEEQAVVRLREAVRHWLDAIQGQSPPLDCSNLDGDLSARTDQRGRAQRSDAALKARANGRSTNPVMSVNSTARHRPFTSKRRRSGDRTLTMAVMYLFTGPGVPLC